LRIDNFIPVKEFRIYIRVPDYDNENRVSGLDSLTVEVSGSYTITHPHTHPLGPL
jgi:hypothetical protein